MISLTSKQEAFVRQMAEGDDYTRRGFDLLLKRTDFVKFFDALAAQHLFDPDRNPGPLPSDTPGYFRIPYWESLRYLEAVARTSGERNDLALAEKVLDVVRRVSAWREAAARPFVAALYRHESEIVRRVAIYVLDAKFHMLRTLYVEIVGPSLFSSGHLHELYNLLRNHFPEFNDDEKAATLQAIRNLPKSDTAEDPDRLLKRLQRQWLSAIAGKGATEADAWFKELLDDPALGGLSPHPDLMSYMETRWGHGPTPYPVDELIIFAKEGTIVEKLNSFTEQSSWPGPSTRSLADALTEAVNAEPAVFLAALSSFLDAKRPYQYGIISGFKKAWDAATDLAMPFDWSKAWPKLLDFFRNLIEPEAFWFEEVIEADVLTPTRDWIPSVIGEFLRAGTRNDEKAYVADLLPQGWFLIEILVNRSMKQDEAEPARAMDRAINSPKGVAIEALVDHALRCCRLSDARSGQHSDAWTKMALLFDQQLVECRNDNFEFSTLAGAYIAHIHYMSRQWCEANFANVFPKEFRLNCLSALDGLAYAPPSGPIYDLLSINGIVTWALRNIPDDYRAREHVLERIALAYLWEKELLNSENFVYIFEQKMFDDLRHISHYLWSVSGQPLTETQKRLILEFWRECVARYRGILPAPAKLFSSLSRLAVHLESIGQQEQELLLAVAPHVGTEYNADDFVKELNRLVDLSPIEVCKALQAMLSSYLPEYDFEDRLKNLLFKLATRQDTRIDALKLAERLVGRVPGMVEFYQETTSIHPAEQA
jgi:hypothetical protein